MSTSIGKSILDSVLARIDKDDGLLRKFILASLFLYGVGAALSQSLASLGGTLFTVYFWLGILFCFSRLSRFEKWACRLAAVYTLYLFVNLVSQHKLGNLGQALTSVPLWVVPFSAIFFPQLTSTEKRWLDKVLIAAFSAVLFKSLYQVLVLNNSYSVAWHNNPIYLSYSLLPALVFYAHRLRENIKSGLLWYGISILSLALLLTASRVAIIVGLSYCTAVLFWPRRVDLKNLLFRFLLSFAALSAFLWIAWQMPYFQFKFLQLKNLGDLVSFNARVELWKYNFSSVLDNPFFGVGYKQNAVNSYMDPIWGQFNLTGPQHYYAHNIYLQILAESGFVGFVLVSLSLFFLFKSSRTILPVVIVTMIAGLTENTFSNSRPFHAFLFFVLIAFCQKRGLDSSAQFKRSH